MDLKDVVTVEESLENEGLDGKVTGFHTEKDESVKGTPTNIICFM